jgi:hypothetical protein
MEAQAQRQQVLEGLQGDLARDARGDRVEQELAQLGEQRHRHAQRAVGEQQRDRHGEHRARIAGLEVERIDDVLEHERHADVRELRADQAGERDRHAPAPAPQVRRQPGQRPEQGRRLGRGVVGGRREGGGARAAHGGQGAQA